MFIFRKILLPKAGRLQPVARSPKFCGARVDRQIALQAANSAFSR